MKSIDFLRDVRGELRHVKWPTRRTTMVFSVIVVVLSIIAALYLGAFDLLFSEVIKYLI